MKFNQNIDKEELISFLSKYVKDKFRFDHSISTAKFMKKHSKKFNINKKRAYISGLFHDLGKDLDKQTIINLSESFYNRNVIKINYFEIKKKHPVLLHGIASAEIILSELGIDDIGILEAVSNHTLGGKNLSILAQFTFMADFCEPMRSYPPSRKIYKIITKENNFFKAYYFTYYYMLKRLIKQKKNIFPESIDGYNVALRLYKSL